MKIQDLEKEKQELLIQAQKLSAEYERLYANVDIESPISPEEKSLKAEIAAIYSRINQIVIEKNKLNKETVK